VNYRVKILELTPSQKDLSSKCDEFNNLKEPAIMILSIKIGNVGSYKVWSAASIIQAFHRAISYASTRDSFKYHDKYYKYYKYLSDNLTNLEVESIIDSKKMNHQIKTKLLMLKIYFKANQQSLQLKVVSMKAIGKTVSVTEESKYILTLSPMIN